MPPKKATGGGRGRAKGNKPQQAAATEESDSSNPFESMDEGPATEQSIANVADGTDGDGAPEKSIPADLLTRVLHEFFAKEGTRISRDANAAVGKYMDVFVREAIARAAVEKRGGFLEVSARFFFVNCR